MTIDATLYVDDRPHCIDGQCPDCEQRVEWRRCEGCGALGWVLDCGHRAQPRPIAAEANGVLTCDECAGAEPPMRCDYCESPAVGIGMDEHRYCKAHASSEP